MCLSGIATLVLGCMLGMILGFLRYNPHFLILGLKGSIKSSCGS